MSSRHTTSNIRNVLLSVVWSHSSVATGASLLFLLNCSCYLKLTDIMEITFWISKKLDFVVWIWYVFFFKKAINLSGRGVSLLRVTCVCNRPLPHLLYADGDFASWNTVKDWKKDWRLCCPACVHGFLCAVRIQREFLWCLSTSSAVCSQL